MVLNHAVEFLKMATRPNLLYLDRRHVVGLQNLTREPDPELVIHNPDKCY